MAETSFVDRHFRGESLRDHCVNFTPAYAPADTSLTVANFGTFLGQVGALERAHERKIETLVGRGDLAQVLSAM